MRTLIGFVAGVVFGIGLLLARMVDPAKVLNFLDLTGHWDPSLAFVMGGGVIIAAIGFAIGRRQAAPWLGGTFPMLARHGITSRLVFGAGLFGLGWGLVGLCPGPALTALPLAPLEIAPFVVAMIAGIWLVRLLTVPAPQPQAAAPSESFVQNSRYMSPTTSRAASLPRE